MKDWWYKEAQEEGQKRLIVLAPASWIETGAVLWYYCNWSWKKYDSIKKIIMRNTIKDPIYFLYILGCMWIKLFVLWKAMTCMLVSYVNESNTCLIVAWMVSGTD